MTDLPIEPAGDDGLAAALVLAAFVYEGQIDNFGQPRIFHALRVMEKVRALGAPLWLVKAALLHDVIEHGDIEIPELQVQAGDEVAATVFIVSRTEGESAKDFNLRCAAVPAAKIIREADLRDKLDQLPAMYEAMSPVQRALREKYEAGLSDLGIAA